MNISKTRSVVVAALLGALTMSTFAVNAEAIDSRCKVSAKTPWTDGKYVSTMGMLDCSAKVGEKVGGQVQRWGWLSYSDLATMKYSPASPGAKWLTSPVPMVDCNGSGTKNYRGKGWGRSTDETTSVKYSSDKDLKC